ncbi:LacI family DNA-binding transcriptional regulator [Nocardiopsis ansamitocini]|uniref:LacI family transcriptional regulator n=1 Tax=Nocardiopsis ansamitocini TaxID=1670832 RepID=A0A9W6UH36_9ACTN|nr:LacI family DNA-binding transcriptional regulator [Nocardiopsis ansamitocini]GLU46204.1 LacI family transcriptional regulator [Nocardiopsis ansamitocini]
MERRQRPTLEMVAARAGVGRGTVSRVINGSEQVSPATREAVQLAVRELGYVPNRAARTLVTRRTDTVALVVSETNERLFSEPFYAGIVRGVGGALSERGFQLLLAMGRSGPEHERLGDYLTGQHVDGVLLLSLHRNDPLPGVLAAAGVPFVYGGRPLGVAEDQMSYVDIDNFGGGRTATQRLVQIGRRRIATITGPQDMVAGVERLQGYREALAEAGIPEDEELVYYGDFSYDSGAAGIQALLDAAPDLDAIFAASDLMGLAALRGLRLAGREVPDDVAVIGYDDSDVSMHAEPPMTTVNQSTELMGREMARVLVDRITGHRDTPARVVLDTHLVVRESA